jgi:hypothetical protein
MQPSMAFAETILPETANLPVLPGSNLSSCAIEGMPGTEEPSPHIACVEVPAADALGYWVAYTNVLYANGWTLYGVAGNGFSFSKTGEATGCTDSLGLTFNPRRDEVGSPVVISFDVFPENNSCRREQ